MYCSLHLKEIVSPPFEYDDKNFDFYLFTKYVKLVPQLVNFFEVYGWMSERHPFLALGILLLAVFRSGRSGFQSRIYVHL